MKKMIVQDFVFSENVPSIVQDNYTDQRFSDIKKGEKHIRVVGTQEEIDEFIDNYEKEIGKIADEVYDFKVPEKGSYWYKHPCFGKDYEKEMKKIRTKIKAYKEVYKIKNKAFIVNK
jgi:hypothetical protein